MAEREIHVVTGAFGYSGKYIAKRLLSEGKRVRTLTNHPRALFGSDVEIFPLDFDDEESLAAALRGASVLYNTYWVRFDHTRFTHARAVENGRRLFRAARRAGVERVVHVSITNPDERSRLGYFRGKALLENALRASGLSHAILRPAVLFGGEPFEDILINNIAWMLRRLPVMGVFGDGAYRLCPIHVDDLAALAVDQGAKRDNLVVNAIGPESFTYRGLIETLGRILGCERPVVSVPPLVGWLAGRALGALVRDVVITRDEIEGLMAGLLEVDAEPTGTRRLSDDARERREVLGREYANELARR